jgi:hypothetical protein
MDSLFAKLIVSVSLLLGIATGALYIQADLDEINLDFKDGDSYPVIYEVNVENIGAERARFDILTDTPWIFVYKEYEPVRTSIQVPPGNVVMFIIEVHSEQAADGIHEKMVTIRAANPSDSSVYEEKEIPIVISKNIVISSPSAEFDLEESEGVFQKLLNFFKNLFS